jgi:hypothetical protein
MKKFLVHALALVAFGLLGRSGGAAVAGPCQLGSGAGSVQHVVYLQFDNVHLTRDNPNVKSDLELMPHLLGFLEGNGTVFDKHYTVLISHTAGGITSSLTGLYPDRMGITVSNSYDYYNTGTGVATNTSGFKYWTAPVAAGVDGLPNMVNRDSGAPLNTPAPWVAYTRAGCDVGNVSVANTVLENANAVTVSGGPTSLAVASSAGDTNIKVASVSGLTAGKVITIDTGGNAETATIMTQGTSGALGTGLTLTAPLANAHALGVTVYGPTSTDGTGDLTTIFGAGSPEWNEGKASQTAPPNTQARALAQADFVGIAIHCGKQAASACASNPAAHADRLPDEPGGYTGFSALYGGKSVNPAITGGGTTVDDLNGNPIADPFGNPGVPGFDSMPASTTLGYVAQMLEAGIPVVYGYISDVHDNHAGLGAYGPGEAGYVAALQGYDAAFVAFFTRLADDGINPSNTLFVVTADENDHYAGEQAEGCDGEITPCAYNTVPGLATGGKPQHGIFDVTSGGTTPLAVPSWPPAGVTQPLVGEVGYNIKWNGLLGSTISGAAFDISFDSAPSFYINGQPQAVDASGHITLNTTLRAFEQAAGSLMAFDPYLDSTHLVPAARYLADAPALKAIHMINGDPQRTMSFTMFSQPDFFFETFSPCPSPSQGCVNDGFAWIHGDYSNDIGKTWLGIVGPGVRANGRDETTWTDHSDIVPTIMSLVGLKTDYTPDGRTIVEGLTSQAAKVGTTTSSFVRLGTIYKQINAPYGDFNHSILVASTNGIKSDDLTYLSTEQQIQTLTAQRDALANQIKTVFNGKSTGQVQQLIRQGEALLASAASLAGL